MFWSSVLFVDPAVNHGWTVSRIFVIQRRRRRKRRCSCRGSSWKTTNRFIFPFFTFIFVQTKENVKIDKMSSFECLKSSQSLYGYHSILNIRNYLMCLNDLMYNENGFIDIIWKKSMFTIESLINFIKNKIFRKFVQKIMFFDLGSHFFLFCEFALLHWIDHIKDFFDFTFHI